MRKRGFPNFLKLSFRTFLTIYSVLTSTSSYGVKPDHYSEAKRLVKKGDSFNLKGKYEVAILKYTEAIRIKPEFGEAYLKRGCLFYKEGEIEKAKKDFDYLIELEKENDVALFLRGLTNASSGVLESAFKDFSESIRIDSNVPIKYYERGRFRYKSQNLTGALDDIDHAISLYLILLVQIRKQMGITVGLNYGLDHYQPEYLPDNGSRDLLKQNWEFQKLAVRRSYFDLKDYENQIVIILSYAFLLKGEIHILQGKEELALEDYFYALCASENEKNKGVYNYSIGNYEIALNSFRKAKNEDLFD